MTGAVAVFLAVLASAGAPRAETPGSPPGDEITAPAGFRVDRLHVADKDQGSWVAMTFDGRGRIIASAQQGPLFRITLPNTEGVVRVERLDVALGECHGLLWAWDSLFCVANGAQHPWGLYRARDTDGDDRLDAVETLASFTDERGRSTMPREHGPHQIVKGPDERLYLVAGNNTLPPRKLAPDSPYRNWAEDLLLPRRPDGRGHNTGVLAPGGWVASTDRDARTWRLIAGGLRNPYDLAFDSHGDLFTFDADMEWDVGTSWYRPTRVNHLVSGGEFGWRFGTGKWPAHHVDSVGSVVDVGLGSPTGITFGHGLRFPARYQRALFVLDWSYGRIFAVHLMQAGASHRGRAELFLQGKPLPVTDAAVGPDGALYFITGGRQTRTGLYRVRYVGPSSTRPAPPVDTPAAARARALRRRLEAFHGHEAPEAVALAWEHLGSADRAIRYAARVALEHQPFSAWEDRLFRERRPVAAMTGLVGAIRHVTAPGASMPADRRSLIEARIHEALGRLPLRALREEAFLDALRAYGLAFIRLGRPAPDVRARALAHLSPLYPRGRTVLDRELASLLVYLEAPDVVPRTLALMKRARTQEDQLHFAFVLRNARQGWSPEGKRAYFTWLRHAEAAYQGGASWALFLQGIREDALANFVTEADRPALADVLAPRPPADAATGGPRSFVREWKLEDLEGDLEAVSRGRSFERGRAALEAVQCLRCHAFQGRGGGLGPDLSYVGNRFGPRELLESILQPSAVLSDQYQTTQLVLKNGDVVMGALAEETAADLVIRPSAFSTETVRVPRKDIATRGLSDVSMMPSGLIDILEKGEILDLLAYLRAGGRKDDPAFRAPRTTAPSR